MENNHLRLAREYYTKIGAKNIEGIKSYLHSDVLFYSPLSTLSGKNAVLEATSYFMKAFTSLVIRKGFSSDNQAMIVYYTDIEGISSAFPGASLLTFQDNLIVKIELFHDASPFKR